MNILLHIYDCNLGNTWQGEIWKSATTEKGPNGCQIHYLGSRCVGFFFFIFSLILIILLLHTYVCNLRNIQKGERWRAATAEKGPNDSSRVVWALGECFFFLPSYFLILIYVLSHIQLSIYKTYDRNRRRLRRHRQERAQTKPHASFRPRWVFFSINNLYLITYTAFNLQNTQSREMEGGDDEEGFKWCFVWTLGGCFFFFVIFSNTI